MSEPLTSVPVPRRETPSSSPASAATSSGSVQLKASLAGKSYDEQVAMLSPSAAPVQMEKADGSGAAAADAGDTKAEWVPPAPTPYAYSAKELAELIAHNAQIKDEDAKRKTAESWVRYGIQCNRYYVEHRMKTGDVASVTIAATFENDALATFPEAAKAAIDTMSTPRADWLRGIVATFLSSQPVSQEVLSQDKGVPEGAEDKSEAISQSFIKQLDDLSSNLKTGYPSDSADIRKELLVRRKLFEQFIEHHNKSDEQSGIASAKSAVSGKVKQKVTSCNAYQGQLLRGAFEGADAESVKNGEGNVKVEKTTTWGWDMEKKVTTKGPKASNYGFYDTIGRAAKEIGAWTQGAPGLRPKAGDMYILKFPNGDISHIGFFKFHEALPNNKDQEIWHTFDGGQHAGAAMTANIGTVAAPDIRTVYDGATNNTKRLYNMTNNSIVTPQADRLAELRGQQVTEADKKKVATNQDADARFVAGIVDTGKLIAAQQQSAQKP